MDMRHHQTAPSAARLTREESLVLTYDSIEATYDPMPDDEDCGRIILYDYQRATNAAVFHALKADKPGRGETFAVLATGAGKTIIMADYVRKRQAMQTALQHTIGGRRARFLVLQHTLTLVEQNMHKVAQFSGLKCSAFTGGTRIKQHDLEADIVFASIDALRNEYSRDELDQFSFTDIIVDECHHAAANGFAEIIGFFHRRGRGTKLFGLTATPSRGDRREIEDIFKRPCYAVPAGLLIDRGVLVPPKPFFIEIDAYEQFSKLSVNDKDFEQATADIFSQLPARHSIVKHWIENGENRQTIIFTAKITQSEDLAATFREYGVEARAVHSNMRSQEETAIKQAYKNGEFQVLVSVAGLTEGFDDENTSCVIFLKALIHNSTFIQALGRGLRSIKAITPDQIKTDCLVFDYTGATLRHRSFEAEYRCEVREVDLRESLRERSNPALNEPVEIEIEVPEADIDEDGDIITHETGFEVHDYDWQTLFDGVPIEVVSGIKTWAAIFQVNPAAHLVCPRLVSPRTRPAAPISPDYGDKTIWVAIGAPRSNDGQVRKPPEVLSYGSREQVRAYAENHLRMHGVQRCPGGKSAMRNNPPTENQKSFLFRNRLTQTDIEPYDSYTASCHLVALFAGRWLKTSFPGLFMHNRPPRPMADWHAHVAHHRRLRALAAQKKREASPA